MRAITMGSQPWVVTTRGVTTMGVTSVGGHNHGDHNYEGHNHGGHNHEGHNHGVTTMGTTTTRATTIRTTPMWDTTIRTYGPCTTKGVTTMGATPFFGRLRIQIQHFWRLQLVNPFQRFKQRKLLKCSSQKKPGSLTLETRLKYFCPLIHFTVAAPVPYCTVYR